MSVARLHTFLICLILTLNQVYAQVPVSSVIENFNNKDFNGADNSNFQISQDLYGYIYSSNFNNLLKYDGDTWNTVEPDNAIRTSLYWSDNYGLLFYGSKDDFGYYSANEFGYLKKTSLLNESNRPKESFLVWNIESQNGKCIYLLTSNGYYQYRNGQLNRLDINIKSKYFEIDDFTYATINDSLQVIEECTIRSLIKLPTDLTETRLISGREDSIHFISSNGEAQFLQNSVFIKSPLTTSIEEGRIYTAVPLKDQNVALGFMNNGLQVLGQENTSYNNSNGLNGEFVKGIYEDVEGNIWLAMQEGIAQVHHSSPFKKISLPNNIQPWTIFNKGKRIYLGSVNGILSITDSETKRLPLNDVVYSIVEFDNRIIASGRQGVYSISDNSVKLIEEPLVSLVSNVEDSLLLVGSKKGLQLFSTDATNEFVSQLTIQLPSETYTDAILSGNSIWIGTKQGGLYQWDTQKETLTRFGESKGLKNIFFTSPVLINEKVYSYTPNGLYKYNIESGHFEEVFRYHNQIQIVHQSSNNRFVVSSKNSFGEIVLDIIEVSDNGYEIVSKNLNGLNLNSISDISEDGQGNYWFASSEGVFKYDLEKANRFNFEMNYNTLISKVSSNDSLIFGGYYSIDNGELPQLVLDQPVSYIPELTYENNALKFEFTSPYFTQNERIKFRFYLEGNEKEWSQWSKERMKEYTNLRPGNYTFHVQAINVFDVVGRTSSYTFNILPPWYMTGWAYVLFTFAGVVAIWLVVIAYTIRIRNQRKKLKLLVADRTYEVLSQKKEIETQNLKLQEQYDEIIHQRDAINKKNDELERSKEEVLSINEQLQRLNQSLEKKVDERTSKIKSTVKKLQKTIAELDTFIYRASHDLKGPISRINGLVSLAKLESTSEQDLKYYDLINLVSKDMGKLLAKLTQVHEVINNKTLISPVDLPTIIANVRESIAFLDPKNQSKYLFDIKNALQMESDEFLLSIIFTNLMENAIVFRKTHQNDHEIKISAHQDDQSYTITVEDNGTGIKEEHVKKVFNMFYRGSDQAKGNGLGLYLTRMAVEKLGGTIKLESKYDQFTKFNISIPKPNAVD